MQQNYKCLAAAAIAALFSISEIRGMNAQNSPLNQQENERVATLVNGEEIRFNVQDPDSILASLKKAIKQKDFASAQELLEFCSFNMFDSFPVREQTSVGLDPYTARMLRFSEKRTEFDSVILSALRNDRGAEILWGKLSFEKQVLWLLDSVIHNYEERYKRCRNILNEHAMIAYHAAMANPEATSFVGDFDFDFYQKNSPENILGKVNPETENGRKLKEDLLRDIRSEKMLYRIEKK